MKSTTDCGHCTKAVAIVEKDGRAAALLKKIFLHCGRGHNLVVEYGDPLPPVATKSVLLLCGDTAEFDPRDWAVCVVERELSDRAVGAARTITFSMVRNEADFTARDVRTIANGDVAFEIVGFGVIGRVRLPGGDLSEVSGALAAACAAVGAGIPFADVLTALNQRELQESCTDGRMYKSQGQFTE
ncbi:hypothetical protein [Caproicibacter sp.]|uniref:hypothetical protein n=1 Tax=Caproicibacter sp. TaxID=2814884 RepID=UPI0039898CAC